MIHPRPWRIEWAYFEGPLGSDSRSLIVDANGKTVATIGTGDHRRRMEFEATAAFIVEAVNAFNRKRSTGLLEEVEDMRPDWPGRI